MLELILSIGIVIITIQGQGILFNKIINNTKSNYKNFNETFLLGIIFLSFNVLFINFFIPINKLIGSIFLLISSGIFFSHFYLSNLKKKYLKIITILIIITFFTDPYINFTSTFLIAMSHQIFLVSFGAFTILMFLIKNNSASKTVAIFFLIPPTTAVMAWMFLNEVLNNLDLIGFATATLGVYIATRKNKV